jgi:hypothetical protein
MSTRQLPMPPTRSSSSSRHHSKRNAALSITGAVSLCGDELHQGNLDAEGSQLDVAIWVEPIKVRLEARGVLFLGVLRTRPATTAPR